MEALIENKGSMRRNVLERTIGLSKSSLANAINQLEQKGILEVDKTDKVHFIRFSEWFRKL